MRLRQFLKARLRTELHLVHYLSACSPVSSRVRLTKQQFVLSFHGLSLPQTLHSYQQNLLC